MRGLVGRQYFLRRWFGGEAGWLVGDDPKILDGIGLAEARRLRLTGVALKEQEPRMKEIES